MAAHKLLLNLGVWVLFVAGVVCIGIGMASFMLGKPVTDFAVHGLGGAGFVTLSAVVAFLRARLPMAA